MAVYTESDGQRVELFKVGDKEVPEWFYREIAKGNLIQHIDLEESRRLRKNVGLKVEIVSEELFIEEGEWLAHANGETFSIDPEEKKELYEKVGMNIGSVVLDVKPVNRRDLSVEELDAFMTLLHNKAKDLGLVVSGSATLVPETAKLD